MLSDHLRMYALSAIQRKGHKRKKEALRKAEQLTVRLRTRRSHILRWAVDALDWYHIIWILNYSLDDYFNRADCKPNLLPALRAFGEPLRAVCLLRSEQVQTAKVCMLGGIEKPSSLADRASDRPIRFHCIIYCRVHVSLSFFSSSVCDFRFCLQTIPCRNSSVWRGFDRHAQGVEARVPEVMGLTMVLLYRRYKEPSMTHL